VIYQRFDFTEMARRSLGPEWRRRTAEEQKEFVALFTKLLERVHLNTIESYNGEKVQYLNERAENSGAQVDTKITDNKGRDFLVNYRLHDVNGDWKIYDVVVEDVSLVKQLPRAVQSRAGKVFLCRAGKYDKGNNLSGRKRQTGECNVSVR
jgi:phospholipid transport system substrate-binding protein